MRVPIIKEFTRDSLMGEGKLYLPDDLISSKPSDHSWTFKGEASEGNEEDKALMGLLDESKVDTAVRVLKEGEMDAIKLEGGSPSRITTARAIVEAGIAVMGHVGLTPLAISVLGGFRPQGKSVATTVKVVETVLALQGLWCFFVVLECVPPPVAVAAT